MFVDAPFCFLPAPCPSPEHTLAWLLLMLLLMSLLCCVMPGLLLLLLPLHAADCFVFSAAAPQGHPAAAGAAAGGSGAAGGGSEELGPRKGPQCGGEDAVSVVLPCRCIVVLPYKCLKTCKCCRQQLLAHANPHLPGCVA